MAKRGELQRVCKNGHDLTAPNARLPLRQGQRGAGECRVCVLERRRRNRNSTKTGPASRFRGDEEARQAAAAAGRKLCVRCQVAKPHDQYGRQSKTYDGLNTYCRQCRSTMKRAAYLANRDEQRLKSRARAFGITVEHLQALMAAQGEGCAICGNACRTGRALALDHDHETGDLRGLLCSNCNRGIGYLQDSPEVIRSALAYLEKWKGGHAPTDEGVLGTGMP